MMDIWFASGNAHKKAELAAILASAAAPAVTAAAWELKTPADAGLAFNPDENGSTFYENALIKARELHRLLCENGHFHAGAAVIADDSGLCVDALGGRPGIYSARYAGAASCSADAGGATPRGKKLSDSERNNLLLAEVGSAIMRSARFVCAMVLFFSPDRFYVVQETLEGEIVANADKAGGTGGFGYDPILFVPELNRTVAELSDAEKNSISHRGKAGKMIAKILWSQA